MPAEQQGQVYELRRGVYGLRYRDRDGVRHRTREKFPTKTAARRHFREVIAPQLAGHALRPELTLEQLVGLYLERHGVNVRPGTVATLRARLAYAVTAYGDVPLAQLERMSGELADWAAGLPARSRYGIVSALRQTLAAAVRWGYMDANPAKLAGPNPQPPPRTVRAFSMIEITGISEELSPAYRPLPGFAAATGLRPEEWAALGRQDVDRGAGVLSVRRSLSRGELVELGKTSRSRRQVPLSPNALAALDQLPARLDTPLLFPAPGGGLLNLDNFRRRQWAPAIEASATVRPARMYDLRSTFASNALAAGIDAFELARVMGTSIEVIERSYGTLLQGSAAGIAKRLAAFEATQEIGAEAER